MLDTIAGGFKEAKLRLSGKGTITEENIEEAIADIRRSLLEADVEYGVTKAFVSRVKELAVGQVVHLKAGKSQGKLKVTPADHFIKICQEELEALMGPVDTDLQFGSRKPAVIMMVGLQGAGKTTASGKLAKFLKDKKGKNPMLVAADTYRPAAAEQLRVLGQRIGVPVHHVPSASPQHICHSGYQQAKDLGHDVVILDTAGRLSIDQELMQELAEIRADVRPENTLLVCDSMMGQDAVTTAKAFDEQLELSGFIMTKLDGDTRGGAALSIKEVTGKPIKFLGLGEGLDQLEEFRPDGLASRILGMGDIVGLMDDFSRVADKDQEEDALKMLQGQFNYKDFYKQIQMIQKMGSLKDIMAKLPMQDMLPKSADVDEGELTRIKVIIDSMTEKERICAVGLVPSRVKRIARGSGRKEAEVQNLVKKFQGMKKMMGSFGKNMGLMSKIPGMGGLGQLSQMNKLAKGVDPAAMSGLGMGGLGQFGDGGGLGLARKQPIDRDKQRKLRKAAKQARKKNRKK